MLQKLLCILFALHFIGTVMAVTATRKGIRKGLRSIHLRLDVLRSPFLTKIGENDREVTYWELCEIETRLARAP